MQELLPFIFSHSIFYNIVKRGNLFHKFNSLDELYLFTSQYVDKNHRDSIFKNSETIKKKSDKLNIKIISYFDLYYPPLLKEIHDPPIVLYAMGNIRLLKLNYISVVGTRNPSPISFHASKLISNFISRFSDHGLISGMAKGIDRESILSSLNANLPTLGVIATGLDTQYPPQNKDIYSAITQNENGVLITETMCGEKYGKWSFPKRNRIISGISKILILMEAPLKSGAISSVNHAISQNREVLVFSHPDQLNNEGGLKLIDEGASSLSLTDITNNQNQIFHINSLTPKSYKDTSILLSQLGLLESEKILVNLGNGYYKKVI